MIDSDITNLADDFYSTVNNLATAPGRSNGPQIILPSPSNPGTNTQTPLDNPAKSASSTAVASPASIATPGVSSLASGALKIPVKPQATGKSPACQRCRRLKQKCEGSPCDRCVRKGVGCSLIGGEGEDEEDDEDDAEG